MTIGRKKIALITGSAGFIGYHVSKSLLDDGWQVVGVDCMSDYYDVSLKQQREQKLLQSGHYCSVHEKVESPNILKNLFDKVRPDAVIHLAAQAGVRYSIENPRAYLESNVNGTFELLEAARAYPPKHMMLASTSSVYGANKYMPYKETSPSDHQMSFYAATKKSSENMAHSYAHLFNLPITMFRFFTVYGPWGRPDMALFKFTQSILDGNPIDVYNNGEMSRDFTYIDDLVRGIRLLMDTIPVSFEQSAKKLITNDSKSEIAPFRVVNIGNSQPVRLLNFIQAIEHAIGKKALINFMPMQPGDVVSTWADTSLIQEMTGFTATTELSIGVQNFVEWYRCYYSQ